jgi:hypothetical protein
MKKLYEYGYQEVGCCAERDKGSFHPVLSRTHLLPITPGIKIQYTQHNSTVVDPDHDNKDKWFYSQRREEVNMSLLVDSESEDKKSAGENEFERWLFDTGASVHITHNKQNLCDCKNITGDTRR